MSDANSAPDDPPSTLLRSVADAQNMTVLEDLSDKERLRLSACYRKYHPDVFWFPGRVPGHPFDSIWARFDPVDIYYVGGFGG